MTVLGTIPPMNIMYRAERYSLYYFFWANQQKANSKIYSITQYDLTINGCDWQAMMRELYDIV